MRRNDRGSILVEASLTIPVFMFTVIAIMLVVIPCIVQAKIANAMNEAAFDFSQNYYLRSSSADDLRVEVEGFMGELIGGGWWWTPDPNKSDWDVSTMEVRNAPDIARRIVPKHIVGSAGDHSPDAVDKVLKKYGVKNGLGGLDFSLSSYERSTNTMTFIVKYRVEMPKFPFVGAIGFDIQKASISTLWSRDK